MSTLEHAALLIISITGALNSMLLVLTVLRLNDIEAKIH